MTKFNQLAGVAACAATLLAAAGSAHAVTFFATVSGAKISFVDNPTNQFALTPNGVQAVAFGHSIFSFVGAGLPSGLYSSLTFNNVDSLDVPATVTTAGPLTTYTQGGFNGTFQDVYAGPTMTVDGVLLVKDVSVLLSGTLSNAVLTGPVLGGVSEPGTFIGAASNFSSVYPISPMGGGFDFNVTIRNAGAWALAFGGNGPQIHNANTIATGGFVSGVPEPASWGMMLVGFGLAGAVVRRRRAAIAA
jgi:hypothetical protein